MDFLNKSFAQLKDLFLSMTPGARITAGLLLAVVVISLGYLFTHEVAGPDVYLLSGQMFSDQDLNRMKLAFGQEGLDSYQFEGNRVRVPRGQRTEYMAAIAKHNAMPEGFAEKLTNALDAGGSIMSSREREARLKIARQQELSDIISKIPGIEAAWVVPAEEIKGGLRQEKLVTASVFVKAVGGQPLDPSLAENIRQFVVTAIGGLQAKDVSVTDWNTGLATLGNPKGTGTPYANPHFALERARAEELKREILGLLSWIPSKTVAVNVELDPMQDYQEEEVNYDPKKTAPGHTSEMSKTRTLEPDTPEGPVGYRVQQNTPASLAFARITANRQEEEESESSQQNLVSSKVISSGKADYPLKRVTVTVGVPTSYFEDIWRKGNPTQEGEQPKAPEQTDLDPIRTQVTAQIKETLATLIPLPEGVTNPAELVHVTEFPNITPPEIPQPGTGEKALTWLGQYWSTLGLIGLAFFSLVMLRSMIRAAPPSQTEVRTLPMPSGETEEEEAESGERPAPRKLKRFSATGASLRDELSDLVGEDPDTAANILRNWIGSST